MKKRILFSASLFHSLNDASTVTVPMIFPLLYSQKFIIQNYSHIGILSYLGLTTTCIFQIIIANFADRFEYKYLLLLSYLGICTALLSITFTSVFGTFLFAYLIFRAFTSFYHTVGVAWYREPILAWALILPWESRADQETWAFLLPLFLLATWLRLLTGKYL